MGAVPGVGLYQAGDCSRLGAVPGGGLYQVGDCT